MRETRTKTTARKTAKKTNKSAKSASGAKSKKPNNGLLTQDSRQNRLSMFLAVLVVVIMLIAVAVNSVSLTRRLKENRIRSQELQREIDLEIQRKADIEEYRRYTGTDAYIEEVAREKLGLIYEGETVFKEDK